MDPQQPEPESGGGMCAKIEGERDEPLALTGQERRHMPPPDSGSGC